MFRKSRKSGYYTLGQDLALGKDAFVLNNIKVLKHLICRYICQYPEYNGKGYSRYKYLKRHQNKQVYSSRSYAKMENTDVKVIENI
jgi:uncharacterized Zn-finger protein